MTIFILFISIIINIISIFGIILLYMRQNRLLHAEQDQKKVLKDMEDMFSSYIIEMKDENEEFIKKVQSLYRSQTSTQVTFEADGHNQKKTSNQYEQKDKAPALPAFMRNQAEKTYQTVMTKTDFPDGESQGIDFSALPLEKQAFLLEKEGLTIEQIAKKLHKGKTEIELILKFRHKM